MRAAVRALRYLLREGGVRVHAARSDRALGNDLRSRCGRVRDRQRAFPGPRITLQELQRAPGACASCVRLETKDRSAEGGR